MKIKAVDALITNFHLPQSTLLMLISALMGREHALDVYRQAVEERYRGHGLGKLLFYRLCRAEKECGAQYMSLFTGIDNPAQNIYKEAGFTPRRYFAVMIKELKP